MSMPRIGQTCAIPRQHVGIPIERAVSRQADAGSAVHRTAAISINNPAFLLKLMMPRFPKFIVRIPAGPPKTVI